MSNAKNVFYGGIAAIVGILIIMLIGGAGKIWETNDASTIQVKQAFYSGDMSVRKTSGTYNQNWGKITTYDKGGMIYFSEKKEDGGDGVLSGPMESSFLGNATGRVSGIMKFKMPLAEDKLYELHELYGSQDAVTIDMVRQSVAGVIKHAGPLFTPEEAWITKRSAYQELVKEMLAVGKYATKTYEVVEKRDGKSITVQKTELVTDTLGNYVVIEESPLVKFGITIEHFEIKGIKFDDDTWKLITAKKKAEQQQITLRAETERAKVEATKAVEDGKKREAVAEADANVAKKTATVEAEKKFEVAKFARMQAEEEAKARLVKEGAEAKANALKVRAGLTPQQRAEWNYKTKVGVAEKLASVKLPEMLIIGGGGKGSPTNPFDAVGLEAFMKINDKMAK